MIQDQVNPARDRFSFPFYLIDCTRVYYVKLNQPEAIDVLAYKEGSNTNGYYDGAKSTFAPYGDWGKAEKEAFLPGTLKLKIKP